MSAPFVQAHGARIPIIGLGTWELRGRNCARMVEQALRLGYRHIDTAELYDNEGEVGEGLRASGIQREAVFITTKVWPSHFAPRDLERSAQQSLTRLRLPHVDLLLLHWPNPQIPLRDTLGALCKVKRAGLTRHIGVSNFIVALLEQAVKLANEPARTVVGELRDLRLRAFRGGDGGDRALGAPRWSDRRLRLFRIAAMGLTSMRLRRVA